MIHSRNVIFDEGRFNYDKNYVRTIDHEAETKYKDEDEMKSSEDDREIEEKVENIDEENVRNGEHDETQNTEVRSVSPRRNRQLPSYLG
nr:unnamed protein product [Callosobruchus analis]